MLIKYKIYSDKAIQKEIFDKIFINFEQRITLEKLIETSCTLLRDKFKSQSVSRDISKNDISLASAILEAKEE